MRLRLFDHKENDSLQKILEKESRSVRWLKGEKERYSHIFEFTEDLMCQNFLKTFTIFLAVETCSKDFPIKDSYLKSIKDSYRAAAESLDFGNGGKSAGVMNDFVKTNTKGKITEIVKTDDVTRKFLEIFTESENAVFSGHCHVPDQRSLSKGRLGRRVLQVGHEGHGLPREEWSY